MRHVTDAGGDVTVSINGQEVPTATIGGLDVKARSRQLGSADGAILQIHRPSETLRVLKKARVQIYVVGNRVRLKLRYMGRREYHETPAQTICVDPVDHYG